MISAEREAEILRLFHAEKWRVGTIASQIHVHHSTVRRVREHAGVVVPAGAPRPSIADAFVPFIVETLRKYPTLRASRLHEMVRARGYAGGADHFRRIVARLRPRPAAEAYLRLRTLPGEQAQVDWAHFGKIPIGQALRPLMAFVMVLSFSRMVFLRFYFGASMPFFLRGHVEAFAFFGSVPRVVLYDNLRSAVLEREGAAVRFHPTLLQLAAHYRYEPRPVAVARGNEKGRVERAIRYVRENFFAARTWKDLDDLNAQAEAWCRGAAASRPCPEQRGVSVREAYEQERPRLVSLPDAPFPADETVEVHVGKTPYVRFDLNDYSVPHTHVRRTLVVLADLKSVRVLDGVAVLVSHPRSFSRGEQIEDPSHIRELVEYKRLAREHRGMDRLHHAVPSSQDLFFETAERGGNLGSLTTALVRLLDIHGAAALEEAIAEAVRSRVPHLAGVKQILDRKRHERGVPPPIPVRLPDDARLRDLVVKPHDLADYEQLHSERDADEPAEPETDS